MSKIYFIAYQYGENHKIANAMIKKHPLVWQREFLNLELVSWQELSEEEIKSIKDFDNIYKLMKFK